MNERAGSGNGGSADASPAMDADSSSGSQAAGQPFHEVPEGIHVRRKMNIGNGIGEKLHPKPLRHRAFFRKSERSGFLVFEEGNKGLDAALLHPLKIVLQPIVPVRPQNHGQRRGGIALDPENLVHGSCNPAYPCSIGS